MDTTDNIIGFAKILDENKNTIRFIDIIKNNSGIGSVRDPYFFMYENLTNSKGTNYNLPVEGLNHIDSITYSKQLDPSSSKSEILNRLNASLPQLHENQVTEELNEIGSFINVQSGTDFNINVYTIIYPQEAYIEFFQPSPDNNDPYGLLNPENVNKLHSTELLDPIDKLRVVILGVNISKDEWNWKDPVIDSVKRPIYWVNRSDQENVNKLPSRLEEFNEELNYNFSTGYVRLSQDFLTRRLVLQIGNRVITSSTPGLLPTFRTPTGGDEV